jgi:hypothetical protein
VRQNVVRNGRVVTGLDGSVKKKAAAKVADVVNKQQFLPPKRSGISIVPRSVLNWMARWDEGDLRYLGYAWMEFRDAFELSDQGRSKAAERKLLEILVERVTERKNFKLFPRETTAVS